MSAKSDRWKNLERDAADHFDQLFKAEAIQTGYTIPPEDLDRDGRLIRRNCRGDDFGREDSDVDVVYKPLHQFLGGPLLVECKYRKGNVLPKLLNDWAKTRPSTFMVPMMILSVNGSTFLARWLKDFQHRDWMKGLTWSDIWITSKKLNKTNKYLGDWFEQAAEYAEEKAKQFDVNVDEFDYAVVTRGYRSGGLIIQKIRSSEI